ncbi:MAG: alpha-1,4-glucan--maltose-1-phosphate maltosyltransferase [Sumerlaeia bacterium]
MTEHTDATVNNPRPAESGDVDWGRRRIVVEAVTPQVDGGRFPVKRVVGDSIVVEADVFVDSHDAISAFVLHRRKGEEQWRESPMELIINDHWSGSFRIFEMGEYEYTVRAFVNTFRSWRRDLTKRAEVGQKGPEMEAEMKAGSLMMEEAASNASGEEKDFLLMQARRLVDENLYLTERIGYALDDRLPELVDRHGSRSLATTFPGILPLTVDRERARFSAWYEFFPRSAGKGTQHGTFKDAEKFLDYVASMGFDVVYLPPIHPIGFDHRKGPNNATESGPDDVGSCWAIGSSEGGHKSVHPKLGTIEDFDRLVARARELHMEIALDIAFQCAPDHPYVKEHPDWFRHRPDGTIRYAENPPKKYQDIYPFDFETDAWRPLYNELKSVLQFWIDRGVKIFRIDNPHTKPFAFWEWVIGELKQKHPDLIFLAEAFTKPRAMERLAKAGFTQSYTYFTWRNTKWELQEYMRYLTNPPVSDIFRPNFWPNTPDILPEYLQTGGRAASAARLVLAGTLSSSYGIYGPAFELVDVAPRKIGTEEYLNSEKYEIKDWDIDAPHSLRDLMTALNRIRRENTALHGNAELRFHETECEEIVAYSHHTANQIVLTVVNLDAHHKRSGFVHLPLQELGMDPRRQYQVHDLITDKRFLWHGERNYVELDPAQDNAHIFRVRRHIRSEVDFDYFL